MGKILKWVGIILAVLVLAAVIGFNVMMKQTKKHSPEDTVAYNQGDLVMEVFYNRPYKKGREIFGGLVPFGEVWRTGANEATTFETNQDIRFGGQALPAGKYTLWTIPQAEAWTVILNGKQYSWGVSWGAQASRDPEADVLQAEVPVERLPEAVEQFTMAFEQDSTLALILTWDQTRVAVPIER